MSKIHTDFGKAHDKAKTAALSFGRSATDNCDPVCRLWDNCYAARIERIYKSLNHKLLNHYQTDPATLVNKAMAELNQPEYIWGRISVDGSTPAKSSMPTKKWNRFVSALRRYLAELKRRGADIHYPIESPTKARSMRAALRGLDIVVRRTSQARSVSELLKSSDQRAWVVAKKIHGGCVTKAEKQANTELAQQHARTIRNAGQTAVVCPAIIGSSKCGACTACASPKVDVVLYPFHP